MRTAKNIRKPFKRYEKSFDQSLKAEETTPDDASPIVYADITASPVSSPVPVKISDSLEEKDNESDSQKLKSTKKGRNDA